MRFGFAHRELRSKCARSAVGACGMLLVFVLGCAIGSDEMPQPSGPVLGDAGTSAVPATTDTTAASASASESSGDPATSGVVDEGSTSATSAVDSTGSVEPGTDESTGGPPPVCPPEPDDVPCVTCGKEACCAAYVACIAEEECSCALDCYLSGMSTRECILPCGATPAVFDLFNCASVACGDVC